MYFIFWNQVAITVRSVTDLEPQSPHPVCYMTYENAVSFGIEEIWKGLSKFDKVACSVPRFGILFPSN